jgi:imidazolonepropionase-like amidohydrolase
VKVFLTGGLANPGEDIGRPALTLAELSAVVQAAQERDSYVVAHAGGSDAVQLGLRAGVRSFEHGYQLDDETVTAMAEAGAFLTPTLTVTNSPDWQRRMGFDEAAIARGEATREAHMASARRAIRAGVIIVAGTDFPGEERATGVPLIVRELQLLVEAGLSAPAAIRAATTTAATLLGLADEIGQVAAGFRADLIAVAEDPTQSTRACADVRLVMQAGEPVTTTR